MDNSIIALIKAFKVIRFVVIKREFSSKEIAEELNCSQRNARRYINALKEVFGDSIIEIKKGKYKWKSFKDFEDKIKGFPIIRIVFALLEIGEKLYPEKKYWKEIRNIFSSINYDEVELNKILFDDLIPYNQVKNIKEIIEEAIKKRNNIKFKYLKNNRFYEIEPYQILLDSGLWYIIGIDIKDNVIKSFSIDLIDKIEILRDSPFVRKRHILNKIKKIKTVWQINEEEPEEIIVEIKNKVSNYFKRKQYFWEQKIIETLENKNILISFKVKNKEDFKLQVFPWIPYIKIISPKPYVDYFKNLLKSSIEFQEKF